jgi:nickel transport protein
MKKVTILAMAVFVGVLLFGLFMPPAPAMAHNMFLTYNTKEIEVVVEFEGGGVAQEAKVTVYNPVGEVYIEGITDEKGIFSFAPGEMEGTWKISAEHSGHKKTVLMEGADVQQSGGGLEMPLYTRIIAGFGYLLGIAGIALFIMSRKTQRKGNGNRISSD